MKKVAFITLLTTLNAYSGDTGQLTVKQHWIGPGNYDRVIVECDTSGLGGDCAKSNAFAIKTDDPNYKALNGAILTALATGMKIDVYGPGIECLNGNNFPVANRIALIK